MEWGAKRYGSEAWFYQTDIEDDGGELVLQYFIEILQRSRCLLKFDLLIDFTFFCSSS
jgi:hypothetical protein